MATQLTNPYKNQVQTAPVTGATGLRTQATGQTQTQQQQGPFGSSGGRGGAVYQQSATKTQTPEQRWGQTQGSLQGATTGYENKYNLANTVWQNAPQLSDSASQMQNPTQYYQQNLGGAQSALGNALGGGTYQGPSNNPYMQTTQGVATPTMPQTPDLQQAQTQYQNPQAQTTQFDTMQLQQGQFDPNSVQGPNTQGNYTGPQTGVPGYQDIVSQAQQLGGAASVPRETLTGSNFQDQQTFGNPNAVSTQAYQQALGAAGNLANTGGYDLGALNSALAASEADVFARAGQAGREATGSAGVMPSGSRGGMEVGTRMGEAANQAVATRQQAILEAAGQRQTGQIAGASQLGSLGSSASQSAIGMGQLSQSEQQNLNQLGVTQRGQDVELAGQNAGQNAQNLQALSGLAGTIGNQAISGYEAGTSRGLGQENLGVSGYEAQTGRQGTLGGLYNQGQQNTNQSQIDAYNASTQRGLGVGDLSAQNAQLGLGYQQLGSQNALGNAQNQLGLYNAQGTQANNLYGTQVQQQLGLGGLQNELANTYQQGQIQQGAQGLQAGQLGADVVSGMTGAQNQWNQQQLQANQYDISNLYDLNSMYAQMGATAQTQREANRTSVGDVLGGVISAGAALGGAALTGGASTAAQAANGYQGIQRQTLNYGGY